MTSWFSKTTLQRLHDLAGLHCTTSERSGPSFTPHAAQFLVQALVISRLYYCNALLFFRQAQSNLYRWFRMQQHDWSSATPKGPMSHLSLSPCTGSWLQPDSSSRHWCLHIEQPQAQHPPTSLYQSTSPPEAWDLRVSIASWDHRKTQNHFPERFLSPLERTSLPRSRTLNPWQFSSDTWKLISSVITWLHL